MDIHYIQNEARGIRTLGMLMQALSYSPQYLNREGVYQLTKAPKFCIRKGMPWPKHLTEGRYPYILKPDGEIRIPCDPKINIRHPELAKDGAVIAAGTLKVGTASNTVIYLDNASGHYYPEAYSMYYMILAMVFWNVPIASSIELKSIIHPNNEARIRIF